MRDSKREPWSPDRRFYPKRRRRSRRSTHPRRSITAALARGQSPGLLTRWAPPPTLSRPDLYVWIPDVNVRRVHMAQPSNADPPPAALRRSLRNVMGTLDVVRVTWRAVERALSWRDRSALLSPAPLTRRERFVEGERGKPWRVWSQTATERRAVVDRMTAQSVRRRGSAGRHVSSSPNAAGIRISSVNVADGTTQRCPSRRGGAPRSVRRRRDLFSLPALARL